MTSKRMTYYQKNSVSTVILCCLLAAFIVVCIAKVCVGSKTFDLDDCTEQELIERCRQRFSRDIEYKTERAVKHFYLKLPHCDIDCNPRQSQKERERMRKILK
jgi:hypothetical protein